MKSYILSISLFLFFQISNAQTGVFKFESKLLNFGSIKQRISKNQVFKFTNIGKAPIIISEIKSSCGCSIAEKPKKPIMPGQKDSIVVSYDAKKKGKFNKTFTVISNAKDKYTWIKIKGNVTVE